MRIELQFAPAQPELEPAQTAVAPPLEGAAQAAAQQALAHRSR